MSLSLKLSPAISPPIGTLISQLIKKIPRRQSIILPLGILPHNRLTNYSSSVRIECRLSDRYYPVVTEEC
ncbi:MAG TPA: hypothetical protein V6D48_10610 [Oculatellaceae cyanobacterium]